MNTTQFTLLANLGNLQNSTAWIEFDTMYRPILHRYAHMCGVSGSAADDLVQDCMSAITQHIAHFQDQGRKGAFRAWLRKIVLNRVMDRKRNHHELQLQSTVFRSLTDDALTPEQAFEQVCREESLRQCLQRVRQEVEPETFDAFRMHVLEEKSVEDVCHALSMTPNQIYKIKWHLTRKVAERMKELDF